jgi:hypothetical protein
MGSTSKGEPWLDDENVEHGQSPSGYFRMANEFARAAEIIQSNAETHMTTVVGANAAHATELALRAFLLSKMQWIEVRGISSRHDLERLWNEAAKRGLPIKPDAPRWCRMLNAAHSEPYLFRYPKTGTGVALPGEALKGLRELLDAVRDALHLDASGNAIEDS